MLVGYPGYPHTCNNHIEGLIRGTGNVSTSQEDPEMENALDEREDCVKESTANTAVDSLLRGRLIEKLRQVLGTDAQLVPVGVIWLMS